MLRVTAEGSAIATRRDRRDGNARVPHTGNGLPWVKAECVGRSPSGSDFGAGRGQERTIWVRVPSYAGERRLPLRPASLRRTVARERTVKCAGVSPMTRRSASAGDHDIVAELRRRFPLLERVHGRFSSESNAETVPWFYTLILAAAAKPGPGACCLVLDKTAGTAALAAVLLALIRLRDEFPELAKTYAQSLQPGQRVRIKPSNLVYEYDGLWEDRPEFFKLRLLDDATSCRTFPLSEVVRVEPTEHKRPKGQLGSPLGSFERNSLDELIDVGTCGNTSLMRNTVILYAPKSRFANVLDSTSLGPEHSHDLGVLASYLPWGGIGSAGDLTSNDRYQVCGEPIVAVTRVPEDLAQACSLAPSGTKTVIIDGARNMARDLQAFHEVADRQRAVVISAPDETEALDALKDHDCPTWHVLPEEILLGEESAVPRTRTSWFGATVAAARTRQVATIRVVNCRCRDLETIAESLRRASALLEEADECQESQDIVVRLLGLFFECCECCFGVHPEFALQLDSINESVSESAMWMQPTVATEIRRTIELLQEYGDSNLYAEEKADAMLSILTDKRSTSWAVSARSPRTAEFLKAGLSELGLDLPVIPTGAFRIANHYAGVVVPGWPNRQRFSQLTSMAVTGDIRVLAFPFERKWVESHQRTESVRHRANERDLDTRTSILGIARVFLSNLQNNEAEEIVQKSADDAITRLERRVTFRRRGPSVAKKGEDSREARAVHFSGNCHALMTEWAELPRLNQLIERMDESVSQLETTTASRLAEGDYVLFRSTGDKEFVRLIAEEDLGAQEYERVRSVAEQWRSPLKTLGTTAPEVHRHLTRYGLERSVATVRAWLGNRDRIGPRHVGDIEAIAQASADPLLSRSITDVMEAMSRIRSAHVKAGATLTTLLLGELSGKVGQIGDQPLFLDLDYGGAWIVHVEAVDSERRHYPSNLVNRLLSFDGTGL